MVSRPKRVTSCSTFKADSSSMLGLSRQEERMLHRAMYDSLKEKSKLPQQLNNRSPSPSSVYIPSDPESVYKPRQPIVSPVKHQRRNIPQRSMVTRSKSVTSKYRQIRLKTKKKNQEPTIKKVVRKMDTTKHSETDLVSNIKLTKKDNRMTKERDYKASTLQEGKRYSPMRRLPLREMLKSLEDRKTHIVDSVTTATPISMTTVTQGSMLKRPASSSPGRKKKISAFADRTNVAVFVKPKATPLVQVNPVHLPKPSEEHHESQPKQKRRRVGRPSLNKSGGDKKLNEDVTEKSILCHDDKSSTKTSRLKSRAVPLYSASTSTRQHSTTNTNTIITTSTSKSDTIIVPTASKRVMLARKLARQSRQASSRKIKSPTTSSSALMKNITQPGETVNSSSIDNTRTSGRKTSSLATRKKRSASLMARSIWLKKKSTTPTNSTSTKHLRSPRSLRRPTLSTPGTSSAASAVPTLVSPLALGNNTSTNNTATTSSPINNTNATNNSRHKKRHYLLYHPRLMIPTVHKPPTTTSGSAAASTKLPRHSPATNTNTAAATAPQSKLMSSSQRASRALLATSRKRIPSSKIANTVPAELWLDPRGNPVRTEDFIDFLLFRDTPQLLDSRLKWFEVPAHKRKQKHFRVIPGNSSGANAAAAVGTLAGFNHTTRKKVTATAMSRNHTANNPACPLFHTNVTVEKGDTSTSSRKTTFVRCNHAPRLTENRADLLPVVCVPDEDNAMYSSVNLLHDQDNIKRQCSAASVVSSSCPTQAAIDEESLLLLFSAPSSTPVNNAVAVADTTDTSGIQNGLALSSQNDVELNGDGGGQSDLEGTPNQVVVNGNISSHLHDHHPVISPRSIHAMTTRHRKSV